MLALGAVAVERVVQAFMAVGHALVAHHAARRRQPRLRLLVGRRVGASWARAAAPWALNRAALGGGGPVACPRRDSAVGAAPEQSVGGRHDVVVYVDTSSVFELLHTLTMRTPVALLLLFEEVERHFVSS